MSGVLLSRTATQITTPTTATKPHHPTLKRIVSVKSTNHFHAAYGPIASAVIYTDGGGPSHLDVRKYPYRKIARPLWPHDPLPPGRMVV